MDDLKAVIFILILLWIIWFVAGGASQVGMEGPFIKPAAPIDTGQTYGPTTPGQDNAVGHQPY